MTKRWSDHRNCNLGSVSVENELLFSPTLRLPTLYTDGPTKSTSKKTSPCLRTPAREPLPRHAPPPLPSLSTTSLVAAFVLHQKAHQRCDWSSPRRHVGLGKIPDTHYPYPNYPNPNPNYPNPRYPIPSSDSDCHYPKLVWVIRVIHSGTQTTRTTRNLPLSLYLFTCC
jgi:hypothetical protein